MILLDGSLRIDPEEQFMPLRRGNLTCVPPHNGHRYRFYRLAQQRMTGEPRFPWVSTQRESVRIDRSYRGGKRPALAA